MGMADELLETQNNLPEEEIVTDTPALESAVETEEPSTEVENELDEKTKQGFQRLVAKKDKELEDLRKQNLERSQKLADLERERKERELSELSEVERLRVERDEALSKMAQTELKSFVTAELTNRDLMSNPLAQDIIEAPWLLRAVRSQLPSGATWEQTIDTVHAFLPTYLDSLVVPAKEVVPETTPIADEIPSVPMDTERNAPAPIVNSKRIWTRKEVAMIASDPEKYQKYKPELDKALAEGRIV